MDKLKSIIDRFMEYFCIILMSTMTLLVTWQVFTRYVLNNPSAVSEVLARYLFVWLVVAAAAYVFGKREHMCIEYVKDKLPDKVRNSVEILIEVITLIFAGIVMLKGGWSMALAQMIQIDATLKIPMGIIYAIIPIGGVITVFYSIYNITQIRKTFFTNQINKNLNQGG